MLLPPTGRLKKGQVQGTLASLLNQLISGLHGAWKFWIFVALYTIIIFYWLMIDSQELIQTEVPQFIWIPLKSEYQIQLFF